MAIVDLNIEDYTRSMEIDQADYGGDTLRINIDTFGSLGSLAVTNSGGSADSLKMQFIDKSITPGASPALLELGNGADVTLVGMSIEGSNAGSGTVINVSDSSTLRFTPQMAFDAPENLNVRIYTDSTFIYDSTGVTIDQSTPSFHLHLQQGSELQVIGAKTFDYTDGKLSFQNADGQTIGHFESPWINGSGLRLEGDTLLVACYLKGTHLATPTGEVRIETLKAGDKVLTANGDVVKVKWLGHRTLYKKRIAQKDARRTFPVLFRKGSIADNIPHRDLTVSPGHHLFFNGNLVPAMALVNNISIVQLFDMVSFEYFHIELEQFDILLAEGVPAESYVDTGNRTMFQNAHEVEMNPNFGPAKGRPDLPGMTVVRKGPALEAIRARLLERANWMQMPESRRYAG